MMNDDQIAGSSFAGGGGTAVECMTFKPRPGTPESIKKFRRSNNLQPGKRFVHPGIADDLPGMDLNSRIHGVASEFTRATAHDLLTHTKASELEKLQLEKAEKVYKQRAREPLGRVYNRDHKLPLKYTQGGEAFGIKSVSSLEPAKDIIFPEFNSDDIAAEEIYIKSHNNWPVGAQRSRGINWATTTCDPSKTSFGMKGDTIAFNGVSKNIADVLNPSLNADADGPLFYQNNVDNYAKTTDLLGKSKNLGQQSGTRSLEVVYGRPSQTALKAKSGPVWGAEQIMQGGYSVEEQKPDIDLGKSITPGFRNISTETRAYGCPSIRTDLPKNPNATRSVSDDQNYGDDVSARDLISPPAYSDLNIDPSAMINSRSAQSIRQLFENIGYTLPDDVFEVIATAASSPSGELTVKTFRDCLNSFLAARDDGMDEHWLKANSV